VCRDVQHVLGAQLQTSLDDPALLSIRTQCFERTSLVRSQSLERSVERQQVSPDDRRVELAGAHRPKSPPSIRARTDGTLVFRLGNHANPRRPSRPPAASLLLDVSPGYDFVVATGQEPRLLAED
jgi:hypothetical protein